MAGALSAAAVNSTAILVLVIDVLVLEWKVDARARPVRVTDGNTTIAKNFFGEKSVPNAR